MVVMRFVVVVLLAGCWRAGADAREPVPVVSESPVAFVERAPTMVERAHGLAALEHETAALDPMLHSAHERILALTNESERYSLRVELHELGASIARLRARARVARVRGDDAAILDDVERQLSEVAVALTKLRHGLRYANTVEELQAFRPIEPVPRTDDRVDVVLTPGSAHWRAGSWISP